MYNEFCFQKFFVFSKNHVARTEHKYFVELLLLLVQHFHLPYLLIVSSPKQQVGIFGAMEEPQQTPKRFRAPGTEEDKQNVPFQSPTLFRRKKTKLDFDNIPGPGNTSKPQNQALQLLIKRLREDEAEKVDKKLDWVKFIQIA